MRVQQLDLSKGIYPKPKRIPYKQLRPKGKTSVMTETESEFLLSGKVLIEEKMDGKTSLFYSKDNRFMIWAEDLSIKHSILYRVPAKYFIFDVLDTKDSCFLKRDDKLQIVSDIRRFNIQLSTNINPFDFAVVPKIAHDKFDKYDLLGLISQSFYSEQFMEGIVVKQNVKTFYFEALGTRGKIVREEFTEDIGENYLKSNLKRNIIDPNIGILLDYQTLEKMD